ncbi:hypothetical protein [Micromonospora sp. NPDC005197]|uniref:hypothetical protein n=1 Tax=Micromonospora sp. NPDC005197 TaxID=3157020 RepID=UPI0033AC3FAC
MASRLAAIVGASGLLAALTGVVVARSFDPVVDGAADVIGSDPLQVYAVPDRDLGAELDAAWVSGRPLPSSITTGGQSPERLTAVLLAAGVVRAGQATTAVTIENKRSDTAVLTAITASVHRRAVPLSDSLVVISRAGGGPGAGPVALGFDLDGPSLSAQAFGKHDVLTGPYLDTTGLTLTGGEKLRFNFVGRTKSSYVEWSIKIDYVVSGRARTLTVLPGGSPMRVTALISRYSHSYRWNDEGVQRVPVEQVCGSDCRREQWRKPE